MREEMTDAAWLREKPRVGISTCLLGERVRYDGQHKWDRYLTDTVGRFVEWVPVCPEVECGLPVPREAMRLVGDPESPRLVTSRTHADMTERMLEFSQRRVQELEKENLCGFIFKSGSPTSGMTRVKVYDESGMPQKVGTGVFARAFMEHFPLVPVEDDGRLHDALLRENFIERIFCLKSYRDCVADRTVEALIDFHAQHKLQLMAHSPSMLTEMGRLVAQPKALAPEELFGSYERLLMDCLRAMCTPGTNANVLMHMMGFFKDELTSDEKQELLDVIDRYRREMVPLVVPLALLQHYVRKYPKPYLAGQSYLNPHPIELKLRNHA